jgi:hypothetical protein
MSGHCPAVVPGATGYGGGALVIRSVAGQCPGNCRAGNGTTLATPNNGNDPVNPPGHFPTIAGPLSINYCRHPGHCSTISRPPPPRSLPGCRPKLLPSRPAITIMPLHNHCLATPGPDHYRVTAHCVAGDGCGGGCTGNVMAGWPHPAVTLQLPNHVTIITRPPTVHRACCC